jgi:hypothetical protein
LVTDLPADFEVFGQAVATDLQYLLGGTTGQVLAKASATDLDFDWVTDASGMTNPMTTTGDVIYSSPGSTPVRLGIGTANQVLRVNSGATAPEWATPSSGYNPNYVLLNSGGTSLSGASVSITGISGKNDLFIYFTAASMTAANKSINLTFNSDTGANYNVTGIIYSQLPAISRQINTGLSNFRLVADSQSGSHNFYCMMTVTGCNSSGIKIMNAYVANDIVESGSEVYLGSGYYAGSSTISSVQITTNGTFDAGTVYVYTTA